MTSRAELEGLLRDREQEAKDASDAADYWKAECMKARQTVTDDINAACPQCNHPWSNHTGTDCWGENDSGGLCGCGCARA